MVVGTNGWRFLTLFLTWAAIASGLENGPQVEIPQGTLQGIYMSSRNYQNFSAYLQIPYGLPPIGERRFQSPVKALPWDGVRDATKDGPVCIQPGPVNGSYEMVGDEDCLYINVYTPDGARSKGKIYPVMVFVYGGAMLFGSGRSVLYGPQYIMDKDVVLVTFNYRIGPLGFLTLEDEVMPGNYGLKDQVLALKWVQKNIRYFGGNPDNVTLFGESAGSVSVAFHLLSKSSQGLFHRAISESGTSLNFWSLGHTGVKADEARTFAKEVQCPHEKHDSSTTILECFRKLDASRFFYNPLVDKFALERYFPYNMGIVLENETTVPDAFITENPWKLIEKPSNTPWIVGVNSGEFGEILDVLYKRELPLIKSFEKLPFIGILERLVYAELFGYKYTLSPFHWKSARNEIKKHYFGDQLYSESFLNFTQLMTDRAFIIPAINAVLLYKGPKYFYEYAHVNEFRRKSQENGMGIDYGAAHADELASLFQLKSLAIDESNKKDLLVSEQMVEYWTNFAIYGEPNGPNSKLPQWKPTGDQLEYLYIKDGELTMKSRLRQEEFNLWNGLHIKPDF